MARFMTFFVALFVLALGSACNQGEFTGGGAKAKTEGKKSGKNDKNKDNNTDKNDKTNDLGNPQDDEPDETPEDNSNDATGKTGDEGGINDVLNGLLGGDQDDANVSQPAEDEIIFGGTKVFHIGDSQMDTTSCPEGIGLFSLAGRRYFFEFEVKEPDTSVNIQINRICGVDYSDTNVFAIAHGGAYIQEQLLGIGATSATMSSQSNLAPGRYAIAVESKIGSKDADERVRATDADDYIVGEVRIKASKPIKPGKVGAN